MVTHLDQILSRINQSLAAIEHSQRWTDAYLTRFEIKASPMTISRKRASRGVQLLK